MEDNESSNIIRTQITDPDQLMNNDDDGGRSFRYEDFQVESDIKSAPPAAILAQDPVPLQPPQPENLS
jgi:hypothetical protein